MKNIFWNMFRLNFSSIGYVWGKVKGSSKNENIIPKIIIIHDSVVIPHIKIIC